MGKVHGSLARAGKVKSQTPKVSSNATNPFTHESILAASRFHKCLQFRSPGRTSREEEDPQGPRQEENNLHPTIRQCDNDWWQEKGMDLAIPSNAPRYRKDLLTHCSDEPQPNDIKSHECYGGGLADDQNVQRARLCGDEIVLQGMENDGWLRPSFRDAFRMVISGLDSLEHGKNAYGLKTGSSNDDRKRRSGWHVGKIQNACPPVSSVALSATLCSDRDGRCSTQCFPPG